VKEVDEHELHVERIAALVLGKATLEACVRVPHESRLRATGKWAGRGVA
jgi:transposase